MGNQNQNLQEESPRSRSPVRDLLVVNDQLIRQKHFSEAHDVLQKIESMEFRIQTFHSTDQKLFDLWYRKNFTKDQEQVDEMQDQYRKLAQFHNWVVATAHILDIEMPAAYALMKEEERRYENGTPAERSQIENDRAKRDNFIEGEVHGRYNEEHDYEDERESQSGSHNSMSQILDRLEDILLKDDREPIRETQSRIDRLMTLSDDEFEYAIRDQETAFLLFDVSLSWGESERDFSFFLRMWKLMPKQQQRVFSEVYSALTGRSLEQMVASLTGEASDEDEEYDPDDGPTYNRDEPNRGPNRAERRAKQKQNPAQEETLKGLYRKLIRKLHPDLHVSDPKDGKQEGWIKRVWDHVQKAYSSKDIKSLDRLLKLTLLRLNALDQLTIDEITEARQWLQKDLSALEKEARQLKKSMAWGFSLKKDLTTLTRKIKLEFKQSLNSVQEQIEEMEHELQLLEMLYSMEYEQNNRARKKKQGRPGRRRSPRRRGSYEENQESFSFEDF